MAASTRTPDTDAWSGASSAATCSLAWEWHTARRKCSTPSSISCEWTSWVTGKLWSSHSRQVRARRGRGNIGARRSTGSRTTSRERAGNGQLGPKKIHARYRPHAACDHAVLLLSESRQRLDACGAARRQVARERGNGAKQHHDHRVRWDVVGCDPEEQSAEWPQEQQRTGDTDGSAEGDERETAGDNRPGDR